MLISPYFGGCKYTNNFLFINKKPEFQHIELLITFPPQIHEYKKGRPPEESRPTLSHKNFDYFQLVYFASAPVQPAFCLRTPSERLTSD